MVQRKVLSKLGIQADHVKCDKRFPKPKLPSSQQDGMSNKGIDMKKKIKNSRPFELPDLMALKSPPPRRLLSQPQKAAAPPLHIPTAAASLQQKHKPLVRTINGSPNYMKPTSSSDAKKEPFPVSLRNTQSRKNLQQRCYSSSKVSFASCKKPAKSSTRSSSSNPARTLTKPPSFKPSRASPRKSTAEVVYAETNQLVRPTCSSTLKDSKFPEYLMINPEGAEFEGASVINVCPYKYCSLNGHCHAPLTPLKSFISASRHLLKTQKSMQLEPPSPQRLMVPCETVDTDIEQIADTGNPIITPLAQEIGMDFFIEKEGADDTGKSNSAKGLDDQDDIKSETDENGITAEEYGVKQVTPIVTCALRKCEIDLEEDFKNHFDAAATEADEHMENIELDGSDSQDTGSSSVFTEEETDSNFESLSESSQDVSVMWLDDDILSSRHADVLFEEALQEAKGEEKTCFEGQTRGANSVPEGTSESMEFETQETDYLSNGIGSDQSLTTEVFQHLTNAEDKYRQNEKHEDDDDGCTAMLLDEDTVEDSQGHKMCETCEDDESHKESNTSLENDEDNIVVQDQELLDEDQVKASKFQITSHLGGEEQNTSKDWRWEITRRKRPVQDGEETRKIKLRKPNFLPLVPEPEPEKVNLKHQMMDERKNSEEWMIDFALRQAVTELAPTGKRKVAMLVEAFETVMPIPKRKSHVRNNSPFSHARTIQACS